MAKATSKVIFVCQQCGRESPKWLGRCPGCQEWNSFLEEAVAISTAPKRSASLIRPAQELSQVVFESTDRIPLNLNEFDRVLGGGLVPGSLLLIGGDPGIGKSTLLLQVADLVSRNRANVVYVSGEETRHQIKLRAKRLGISGEGLYLITETDLEAIIGQLEELSPGLVVIDSIQAVYLLEMDSLPGSINQVRASTMRLMNWAKNSGVPVLIVGHVTKDGSIAGPKVLEHIVDTVLYLEGEPYSNHRLLRGVKNRYGSTNEIGVFEMRTEGMIEVENPSKLFISQRDGEAVGSAVVPILEGSRPFLVEIQALTNTTSFGLPRRTANGVDFGRLLMIAAVLSKRLGLKLGNQDIMVNVVGGLKVGEPAADLAIALAIASSFRDAVIAPEMAVIGEIGLSGELRAVPQMERRLEEVARLGFKRCLVPRTGKRSGPIPKGIEVITAGKLKEAIAIGLAA